MIPLGRQYFYDCKSLFVCSFSLIHLRSANRSMSMLFIIARIIIFLVNFFNRITHMDVLIEIRWSIQRFQERLR